MESKLGLNFELVNRARASAAKIADDTQHFIDQHTTVTVERAVCRLLGIDGVNDMDVPLPNVVVDHLMANSLLPVGAAWAIGNAMVETGKDPQGVAEAVNSGELDLSKVPAHSDAEIRGAITPVVNATVERINKNVGKRNAYLKEWGDKEGPYLYIIVATGNIYEDITQAKAGAKQGADIIAGDIILGHLAAIIVVVSISSAIPPAIFPITLALAGATIKISACLANDTCSTLNSKLRSNVSTRHL